jgi:hypothetical protein
LGSIVVFDYVFWRVLTYSGLPWHGTRSLVKPEILPPPLVVFRRKVAEADR